MSEEVVVPKFDASARKKKRTTKKRVTPKAEPTVPTENEITTSDENPAVEETDVTPSTKTENGNEDYAYDFLLTRVFGLIHDKNPNLMDKKSKTVQTIPEVFRSTKKTVWHNFQQTAKNMNRNPEHLLAFALSELGTTGTLDGNKRLVVRGRFTPRQLENVQKNYIAEYITCRNCLRTDTILKKESRLYFILCQTCGATRTVQPIKTGFVAQVAKRKKE